jgi:hypothetical protein
MRFYIIGREIIKAPPAQRNAITCVCAFVDIIAARIWSDIPPACADSKNNSSASSIFVRLMAWATQAVHNPPLWQTNSVPICSEEVGKNTN